MTLKSYLKIFFAAEAIITIIREVLLYWQLRSTTPSAESIGNFIVQSMNILLDYTNISWILYYGAGGLIAFVICYFLDKYGENEIS